MRKTSTQAALCLMALFASGGARGARGPQDAAMLLNQFRRIDWNRRVVGKKKDLADHAWKTRVTVEHKLIALGPKAVKPLIAACRDANRHVRGLAAYCLGFLNDRSATQALARQVKSDADPIVRLMAVEALGRLGDPSALATVRAALMDMNRNVKVCARQALPRVRAGRGAGDALRRVAMAGFDPKGIAAATVGKPAPDFDLPDGQGRRFKLSAYRGKKNVVLVFVLADW